MRKYFMLGIMLLLSGCASSGNTVNMAIKPDIKSKDARLVADMTFKVSPGKVRRFYYRFAPRDSVILNAWVVKGNDISLLSVSPYGGSDVMRFNRVRYVLNRVFVTDTGGIYEFSFKNTGTFKSKIYRFTLHRVPAGKDRAYFNTSVFWDTIYDTTYKWVVESTVVSFDTVYERVFFREIILEKNGMRCMKVDLPRNTEYVVYMIGIAGSLGVPITGNSEKNDPLGAFARGKGGVHLKRIKSSYGIDYSIDRSLTTAKDFLQGTSVRPDRWAKEVVLDYGRLRIQRHFHVCIRNNSSENRVPVFVDVVAIKSIPIYDIRRVRKPIVRMYRIPR